MMSYNTGLAPDKLKIDLKQLCSDIVRELYLASQKLLLYPLSHPTREEVVAPAYLGLREWFKFKLFFQIETDGNTLWVENIVLNKGNFVKDLTSLLKKYDLGRVRFYDWMKLKELYFLLDNLNLAQEDLATRLYQQKVTSIEISSLIRRGPHYDGDVPTESDCVYTVESLAEGELRRNPSIAIKIILDRFEEEKIKISFRKEVLYQAGEKVFADLSSSSVCRLVEQELRRDSFPLGFEKLMQRVVKHPQGKSLMLDLEKVFKKMKMPKEAYQPYFEKVGLYFPEKLIDEISKNNITTIPEEDFLLSFSDLLKEEENGKLRLALNGLVGGLTQDDISIRRKSLSLIRSTVDLLINNKILFGYLVRALIERWDKQKQTFEILDALGFLAEKSLVGEHYSEFQAILGFLRRKIKEESLIYKQGVFRKAVSQLTDTKVVNVLIGNMSKTGDGGLFEVGKCLELIHTYEVAEKLSRMIKHPQSAKRVACLNILAQMGDYGIKFISRVFLNELSIDNLNKKRLDQKSRIRILEIVDATVKSKSQEATWLLEKICEIRDTQVKSKVASALKYFESPKAVSLLKGLVVDVEPKIRRRALDSLRDKVQPKDLGWLRAIYFEDNDNLKQLTSIIAKLGTQEADQFLLEVLEKDKRLRKDPSTGISVLMALSKRGRVSSKEEIWRLKHNLERGRAFPLRKLILKRRVKQLIRQELK